jgi:4'-phosphopantetheinyl transferase
VTSRALMIGSDEIRIWPASLDLGERVTKRLAASLAPDELRRAARLRFDRDRDRYVVGRGLLRMLLGRVLGRSPAELEFAYTPHGKPFLANGCDVSFNVSHSGDYGLFAVARTRDLGIDLEELSSTAAEERVAEHFFAPREVAALRALPREEQPQAFLRCWTRKEAYVKARGDGLSLPLHDFEVTLAADRRPALVHTAWSRAEPEEWSMYDVSHLCPRHVAALAVRGRTWRITSEHVDELDEEFFINRKEPEWHS